MVLHDHARAEEITQDAFVRLLQHWNRVSRYDRPGAWVRRVAIRLATREAAGSAGAPGSNASGDNSDVPASTGVRDLDLWKAIRTLPPRQRAVVALYYLEDMSVSEVADIVGCSESTVSVHLHRARHRLAEIVGEEVETHVD